MFPGTYAPALKLVVVGDSGVGKTCLLVRFVRDMFEDVTQPTLGVEFMTKMVEVGAGTSSVRRVHLQLWDTAGQEMFWSVGRGYYRGASAAAIVFDVTQRSTFDDVLRWEKELRDVSGDIGLLLIGNKCDKVDREVNVEEARAFAEGKGMLYYETSALTGAGVQKAFMALVEVTAPMLEMRQMAERAKSPRSMIHAALGAEPRKRRRCC